MDFIFGLPFLILGVSWCFADAAERDHRIGRIMKFVLILLFIVGLPLYLFQTRGIGAFKAIALAVMLVVAICACQLITAYATLHLVELAGFWEVVY